MFIRMRYVIFVSLASIFSFSAFASWQFDKISALSSNIFHIAISSLDKNTIFVSSQSELFRSEDKGKSWERIFVTKSNPINYIVLDSAKEGGVFLVTAGGLYLSRDKGNDFLKIYRPAAAGEDTEKLLCLAQQGRALYLGTSRGLYSCDAEIYKWRRISGMPETEVYYILPSAADHKAIFLATGRGGYKYKEEEGFRRLFVVPNSPAEDSYSRRQPTCLVLGGGKVYLGTSSGLYRWEEKGKLEKIVDFLPQVKINSLWYDKNSSCLYVASEKGLYSFNIRNNKTECLYRGISSIKIRDVVEDSYGRLWVATAKGVFVSSKLGLNNKREDVAFSLLPQPDIREVQEAALRYNAVHPEKIKKWRRALRYRALMPTLNLSYDKTIYGTAGTNNYNSRAFVGPRDWSVSLSWDIGDLVWNAYEDDIDTRARLDTQLRLDILDDVNRIYFERKRLALKLKEEGGSFNTEDLRKTKMRIEELTATLDGYTGGFFSRRLKELRYEKKD